MSFLDPIQRVIDWQLRCRWPGEDRVPQQSTIGDNYVEERLVEAIDEKYLGITNRHYRVLDLYADGWTQDEIGLFFGISDRTVRRILKKIRESVRIEGKICPC